LPEELLYLYYTVQRCQKRDKKRNTGKIFYLTGGEVRGYNLRNDRLLA